MVSALGARTAARYRQLRAQALAEASDRPLDALLLSLLLKAERLYVRLQRLLNDTEEGEKKAKARRMLVELTGTAGRVRLLERLNGLLDVISHDCGVPEHQKSQDWRRNMNRERTRQAKHVCRVLGVGEEASNAATTAAGVKEGEPATMSRREVAEWVERSDPEEQVEVLTLLRHAGDQDNAFVWTESEVKALQAAYLLVADASNALVQTLPDWFVAPSDSELTDRSQAGDADLADDDMTLLFLSSGIKSGAFPEEQMIREAGLWASVRHPNVVRLGGACHVGGQPFFAVSAHATQLSAFFRSLHPQVVRHKVFIPMVLYEMAMALQLVHERGLAFSRGDAAGSCLSVDHVYCVPEDDKVRLLAAGLTSVYGHGTAVAVADGQQAKADDICALGAAMADVLLMTHIPRPLSPTLWSIVDLMCQSSDGERITLHDVLASLKEMLWSRGEGMDLPSYPSEITTTPSEERWAVISPGDVTVKQPIGEGSFASVHLGSWNGSQDVAVKQILLPNSDGDSTVVSDLDAFKREMALWYQLNHVNVVEMYGASRDGEKPFIVCEYASRGNLPSYIRAESRAFYVVWSRLLEAARGLQYLHRNGIIHGDIKGNNIVVGADGIAKLIDFGASFFASEGQPKELEGLGPVRWKAPECLPDKEAPVSPPTLASDVYSFGMCIIEAVSGEAPWGTLDDAVVAFQVKNKRQPQRPDRMTENEMSLVQRICSFAPEDRLSMDCIVRYLECLVERLESPAKVASTPASLRQHGPSITDLLSLATTDLGDSRTNQILDPENFFLTVNVLRRHPHEWTSHQLSVLLSLLGTTSDSRKLWAVRTLGQVATGKEATVKSIVSGPEVIASLVEFTKSEAPELQLAATLALQRLSIGNDIVKCLISGCGGLGALLTITRSESTSLEVKKAATATLRNAVTVTANRGLMVQPRSGGGTTESGCATVVAIVRSATSGGTKRELEDIASMRVNAVGALRNLAFGHRECASAIINADGIALLVSVLGNGADAEKIEAAGALWNIAAASKPLGEQVATHEVVHTLLQLVQSDEGSGGKSSLALQEQVVGALSAVMSSLRQRSTADSNADDPVSVEAIGSSMKHVAKASESAAVRALAADCALQALGKVA